MAAQRSLHEGEPAVLATPVVKSDVMPNMLKVAIRRYNIRGKTDGFWLRAYIQR